MAMKKINKTISVMLSFVMLFSAFSLGFTAVADDNGVTPREISSLLIKEADCKTTGVLRHYFVDGTRKDEEIPVKEHELIRLGPVPSTCTNEGSSAKLCVRCKERFTEPIPVDETAHKPGKWLVTVEPDDQGNKGVVEQRCELCGEVLGSYSVDSLTSGDFAGGDGSRSAPYLIYTPEQFNNVGHITALENDDIYDDGLTHYLVINDLEFNGAANDDFGWQNEFILDGGNHVIDGITKNGPVFGRIYCCGFYNLYFTDLNVNGPAGLVAENSEFWMENCHVSGVVKARPGLVGMFGSCAGIAEKGRKDGGSSIKNCSFDGTVEGGHSAGIVTGSRGYDCISGCIVSGDIIAKEVGGQAGGIISGLGDNCAITDCVNMACVTAKSSAGGIVGVTGGENVLIERCANLGNITAPEAGGIVAAQYNARLYIRDCYNTGEITTLLAPDAGGYNSSAGGIVGESFNESSRFELLRCYNAGKVSGDDKGSVFGAIHGSTFVEGNYQSVYYLERELSGNYAFFNSYKPVGLIHNSSIVNSAFLEGATKCSLAQMEDISTFIDCRFGFDFEKIWAFGDIDGYTYPTLQIASSCQHPNTTIEPGAHVHDFDYRVSEVLMPSCVNGITEHFCSCGENETEIVPPVGEEHSGIFELSAQSWRCERCGKMIESSPVFEVRQIGAKHYVAKALCDYEVTLGGDADKIQLRYPSGSTKTFTRADAAISPLDNGGEKWVISASLAEGSYEVSAKYGKTWSANRKGFDVSYNVVSADSLVLDFDAVYNKPDFEFTVVTIPAVDKIQLVSASGSTMTFTADQRSVLSEDGKSRCWSVITKAKSALSPANLMVRYNKQWTEGGVTDVEGWADNLTPGIDNDKMSLDPLTNYQIKFDVKWLSWHSGINHALSFVTTPRVDKIQIKYVNGATRTFGAADISYIGDDGWRYWDSIYLLQKYNHDYTPMDDYGFDGKWDDMRNNYGFSLAFKADGVWSDLGISHFSCKDNVYVDKRNEVYGKTIAQRNIKGYGIRCENGQYFITMTISFSPIVYSNNQQMRTKPAVLCRDAAGSDEGSYFIEMKKIQSGESGTYYSTDAVPEDVFTAAAYQLVWQYYDDSTLFLDPYISFVHFN